MPRITAAAFATVVLCAAACQPAGEEPMSELPRETEAPPSRANPLLEPSPLPYGLPPFGRIETGHFRTAFEAGMREQREEVEAIASSESAATFANTLVALERSGRTLERTEAVFGTLVASNTNDTLDEIQRDISPRLAAHEDAVFLDRRLFERVEALYRQRESLDLDAEDRRLLERYHTRFVRAGARLDDEAQARLKTLNETLSTLTTRFRQTVLEASNAGAVVVEDASRLAGLSEQQIKVAAEAARERGLEGEHVVALANTTTQPPLAQLHDRDLRRQIFRASSERGWHGEHATTALIAQIVRARAERARLLGYDTHADYVLADSTAGSPAAVAEMLGRLAPPAVANAKREGQRIQQLIDERQEQNGIELEPWDWQYYAEQVRRAEFAYDQADVRPYFEMNRVLEDGVLFAAQRLFGLRFEARPDLAGYREEVKVYEVSDHDGSALGLVLFDWYARSNKRGGAWMNSLVKQSRLLNDKPVVVNNLNVPKPPAGEPTLLTFDEVETAFHEFGHALHGLLSDVEYPLLSGTSVPRDFVEYPSQYNEMWATDPEVLASYARHYQTGEPMPRELLQKVTDAATFNEGYATTEYLAAALLDQAWHRAPAAEIPDPDGVAAFERRALEAAGMVYPPVPPRYRSTYFSHIFANPIGYSAGYYAYIWSEVLARDTEHWFDSRGGLTRENGDRLRELVLSRGFTREPLEMFVAFKGEGPDIEPLLEARGLTQGGS